MYAPTDWRVRAGIWTIGRPENGGRIATRHPNEVLIKIPIRLLERVGFHRTAHAFSAPLKGGPRRLRAVEVFGSDPSRVPFSNLHFSPRERHHFARGAVRGQGGECPRTALC